MLVKKFPDVLVTAIQHHQGAISRAIVEVMDLLELDREEWAVDMQRKAFVYDVKEKDYDDPVEPVEAE